jgi:hypothetical protein
MLDIHNRSSARVNHLFNDLSIPECIGPMERYFESVNTSVPSGMIDAYHGVVETFSCSPPRRETGRVRYPKGADGIAATVEPRVTILTR